MYYLFSEAMSRDFSNVQLYRRIHLPPLPYSATDFQFEYVDSRDMALRTFHKVEEHYMGYGRGLFFQHFKESLMLFTLILYLGMVVLDKVMLGRVWGAITPLLPWFIGHGFGGLELTVVFFKIFLFPR